MGRTYSDVVSAAVDAHTYDQIVADANKRGISVSSLLRHIIRGYYQSEPREVYSVEATPAQAHALQKMGYQLERLEE